MASIESSEFEFCYVSQMSLELIVFVRLNLFFSLLFLLTRIYPILSAYFFFILSIRHWLCVCKWNVEMKSKSKKALCTERVSRVEKKRNAKHIILYGIHWIGLLHWFWYTKKYQSKWEHARDVWLYTLSMRRRYCRSNNRHNCTQQWTHTLCILLLPLSISLSLYHSSRLYACCRMYMKLMETYSAHMDILWFYVVQPKVFDQIKVCWSKSLIWSLAHLNAITIAAELKSLSGLTGCLPLGLDRVFHVWYVCLPHGIKHTWENLDWSWSDYGKIIIMYDVCVCHIYVRNFFRLSQAEDVNMHFYDFEWIFEAFIKS